MPNTEIFVPQNIQILVHQPQMKTYELFLLYNHMV